MLGKLIKNEFKTTWQSMSGVYMAAGITALLMLVFVVLKIKAITVLGSIALIVIGLVSFIVTLIMTALNYYRSMFGPQGYLSMTLPVKSSQLFFSKAIVSFIWILLSFIFFALILAFLVFYLIAQASDNIKDIATNFYSLLQQLQVTPDIEIIKYLLMLLAVILFIGLLAFVCQLYFSMTLAHTKLFRKMSAPWAAVLVFIAVYIVTQIINGICTTQLPIAIVVSGNSVYLSLTESMLENIIAMSPNYIPFPIGGYIMTIIISVVLYFITSNLLKKSINIR